LFTADSRTDPELVDAAQSGDRHAFGLLYQRYERMVNGVLLARVAPDFVEDLLQDVFVEALRGIRRLRETEAFGGWLAAIARNLAANHYRRGTDVVQEHEAVAPDRPSAEAAEILAKIRELPEAYRETLALRLVEGMTGAEIAERTGLTHGSVRVNLSRGMNLLRERLRGAS
jgi:RNA polymerase sigma-70 factor (ECF subfamily)